MKRLSLTGFILDTGVIVLAPAGISAHGKSQWRCKCFCNKEFVALGSELRSGHTMSCGCYSRSGTFVTKHGHRSVSKGSNKQSPMYTLLVNIKALCLRDPDYAGRGIMICPKWETSFETFLADISSVLGEKPPAVENGKRYWSLDRINNEGNYEIGNVRWASPIQQNNNRRQQRWWKKPEEVVK